MSTYTEIANMIKSFGMDYAYYEFNSDEKPRLPFVVYRYGPSNNFSADDTVYQPIELLTIELYAKRKDFAKEKLIEKKLRDNNLVYQKDESKIDSEKMYMVTYEMEVIINEEE
ncbi:MAG: hypothetical protein IJ675_05360 [Pseudobutyrivibrio sp.]|nr:hypothetical protein [Pseudobutyrivibrio sp.]